MGFPADRVCDMYPRCAHIYIHHLLFPGKVLFASVLSVQWGFCRHLPASQGDRSAAKLLWRADQSALMLLTDFLQHCWSRSMSCESRMKLFLLLSAPCSFSAGGVMQGWTERAGCLPTPLCWCADEQSCSPARVPAGLVAPLEMPMFPKALPASRKWTCNQIYWWPVFKICWWTLFLSSS